MSLSEISFQNFDWTINFEEISILKKFVGIETETKTKSKLSKINFKKIWVFGCTKIPNSKYSWGQLLDWFSQI